MWFLTLFTVSLGYRKENLMSDVSPQQSSPYSEPAPVPSNVPQSGGAVKLLIGLAVGAVLVVLLCGGLFIALLIPAVGGARAAAERVSRENKMKQVGLALHNYHTKYKQLPCTLTTDDNGKVVSTWRIAAAPCFEGMNPASGWTPETAPSEAPFGLLPIDPVTPDETNVFAIVSPNGMFSPVPNKVVRFAEVSDGLANTVMAVKIPARLVDWRSTNELTPDEAFNAIQLMEEKDVGIWLMGDGSSKAIELPLDRKTFDAMITRDGGESQVAP